jgi:hypothetical protein
MGSIKNIPDWFAQGKPQPPSQRATFCVWRYYNKDERLLNPVRRGLVKGAEDWKWSNVHEYAGVSAEEQERPVR